MSELTFTDAGPGLLEGDDRPLIGGRAIQRFHNELLGVDTRLSAIFKQLAKGDIPANKTAGAWITTTRKMRQHYARTSYAGGLLTPHELNSQKEERANRLATMARPF
jgi:hypothetical protein